MLFKRGGGVGWKDSGRGRRGARVQGSHTGKGGREAHEFLYTEGGKHMKFYTGKAEDGKETLHTQWWEEEEEKKEEKKEEKEDVEEEEEEEEKEEEEKEEEEEEDSASPWVGQKWSRLMGEDMGPNNRLLNLG
ncbi:hypothetical protein Pmani_016378 [Petrolisthes manimaculis]|uniref:Uncharacterized protein n=1 Tax=Petrolisthes manimaculis TaxID=1843537 RepID=A0AAE1PRS0_9EUCA|nr:hypothetical protein Pmani_016378 [Petrolisthes manimaculis]